MCGKQLLLKQHRDMKPLCCYENSEVAESGHSGSHVAPKCSMSPNPSDKSNVHVFDEEV